MTLKERRLKAGLRQEDVAKLLEVDQAAVSFWESGRYKPVRKYRAKLARLYDCAESELLSADQTGEMEKG